MAKRLTKSQKQRRKEIRRIKQQVKRGQSRGLYWSEGFLTSLEDMSLKQLKGLNRYAVLREAKAISQVTGKVISGRQAETEQRSLRAKQTHAERRQRTRYTTYHEDWFDYPEEYEYSPDPIDKGETVYIQLLDMIDGSWNSKGSAILRGLLEREFSTYKRSDVIANIGSAPEEVLSSAQAIINYEEDSETGHRAFNNLTNIIRGAFPTEEEAKATGEHMDII